MANRNDRPFEDILLSLNASEISTVVGSECPIEAATMRLTEFCGTTECSVNAGVCSFPGLDTFRTFGALLTF